MIDSAIKIAKKLPFRKIISDTEEAELEKYRFIDLNILTEFIKRLDNF